MAHRDDQRDDPASTIAALIEGAGRKFAGADAYGSLGTSLSYRDLLVQARSVTSWL